MLASLRIKKVNVTLISFPDAGPNHVTDVGWCGHTSDVDFLRDCARVVGLLIIFLFAHGRVVFAAGIPSKTVSVFYPSRVTEWVKINAKRIPWAAKTREQIVKDAEPWKLMSDDELWSLMFGNTIKRSWMVWSNGYCPACGEKVPMYTWEMDVFKFPWKVRCPHCHELFPKNDFYLFYQSGLDEHGVFDPNLGDSSLLFNTEHPEPDDPLHKFGVDDGEGYVEGNNRWRFIGAYLIYGQWKEAIVGGIRNLAAAYVVTGETRYAHKAGVLLDRVADLYPTFDFGREGVMYEGPPSRGYVSTWHDACIEVRNLAIAYDQVFSALQEDEDLVSFLGAKASQYKLDNPKRSFSDIQRNIELRILQDTLDHRGKIQSNYPQTDMSIVLIKTILAWPDNRGEVMSLIDKMLDTATAVDGVSGEKGLAGYATIAPRSMAELLGQYVRIDPGFLRDCVRRHPRLHDMYRFHIDTWCLGMYYPQSGDTGAFGRKCNRYVGTVFTSNAGLAPSAFVFFWSLYEAMRDEDFVRLIYAANGDSVEGLPYDLFCDDPAGFQAGVHAVIDAAGPHIRVASVNKRQWCLAILRSGEGNDRRAVWLDYDAGGRHSHADGMNLGLFAKGLDLMPDFGYPPVQFGGWVSPQALWYKKTAAHNTVMVDGQDQRQVEGVTTLWADGKDISAVRASAPQAISGRVPTLQDVAKWGPQQYERTAVMVNISDHDFYVLDIFRVVGGTDHAKFFHSHFGTTTTEGLSLKDTISDLGSDLLMRAFRGDRHPTPGWSVEWKIQDRYNLLPKNSDVRLRYTDLTADTEAYICEGWIVAPELSKNTFSSTNEIWIPRVMVRRRSKTKPLSSSFVSIIEPYEGGRLIAAIRRLPLHKLDGKAAPDADVAVEVNLKNGSSDLIVSINTNGQNSPGVSRTFVQKQWDMTFDGQLCYIHRDEQERIRKIALAYGRSVTVGKVKLELKSEVEFVEVHLDTQGQTSVMAGNANAIKMCTSHKEEIKR